MKYYILYCPSTNGRATVAGRDVMWSYFTADPANTLISSKDIFMLSGAYKHSRDKLFNPASLISCLDVRKL